jgi:uncharacterized membrane protein
MSTSFTSTSAPGAVPATREFTAAWIAYLAYLTSAILFWPAIVGLIINYSKRGRAETGFIESHHRWMLRTFWWSQLAFLVFCVLMLVGMWPLISDIVAQAIRAGDWQDSTVSINLNWGAIFGTVGAAMFGGLGLLLSWLWFVYRLVRGMIALADARALP